MGAAPDQLPSAPTSVWPWVGMPLTVGAAVGCGTGAAATTAVGDEGVSVEPPPAVAVTTTRSVFAASAEVTAYVLAVAPSMFAQAVPAFEQRCHWNANVGFGSPQVPGSAVR